MPYQVNDSNGTYLGEPRTLPTKGPKPMYPFRDMYVGQWISVPYAEEYRLMRAVRNIRRKGIEISIMQGMDGDWVAVRVR